MPGQLKVFGICLLLLALFAGGLYIALAGDESLEVASRHMEEGTVTGVEKTEGASLKFAAGKGRAGMNPGKMPGAWLATVALDGGKEVTLHAGNPPVAIGQVVNVNLTEYVDGSLSGSIQNQAFR